MPPVRGRAHITRKRPDAIDNPKPRRQKLGKYENGLMVGHHYRGFYRLPSPEFAYEPNPAIRRPTDPRPPPLKLSDMECVRGLGAGAYGEVMLVRVRRKKHALDRPRCLFAMKAVRKKNIRAAEKFNPDDKNDERSILSELPWDPFVAGIIQTFTDQRNIYMMLELIPCGDFRALIQKRGPFSPMANAFYFANIVAGITYLQIHGICHRDLKPENILVGADGYLVLTDFGSAAREFQNLNWVMIGSPAYMAPELVSQEKQSEIIYSGVDWWSAGVILYEMTYRNLPFIARSDRVALRLAAAGVIPWHNDVPVGRHLKSLISGLLTVDAVKRLGTANWEDVKNHEWLNQVHWFSLEERKYLAPYVPNKPRPEERWHRRALPEQQNIPGLKVAKVPNYLSYNDCFPEKVPI